MSEKDREQNVSHLLEKADKLKQIANESFKKQEFDFATQGYTRALKCFDGLSEEERLSSLVRTTIATLRSNR